MKSLPVTVDTIFNVILFIDTFVSKSMDTSAQGLLQSLHIQI